MADDCEFWLPPQFLTDDDTPFGYKNANNNLTKALNPRNDDTVSKALFPYLSSPVESVLGSSETESDEEEHMAELTRRMAHSTLEPDLNRNHHNRIFASENPKGMFLSGSPQSTLCALESSGKGASPNDSVLSQANSNKATWDLLRAAAGEVERMRLNEQEAYGFLRKPSPAGVGFYTQQQQQLLSHQQLQIAQFEMLRRQQLAKQQECSVWGYGALQREMVPNRGRNDDVVFQRSVGLSASAWPSLQHAKQQQQQQYVCGMRAVFPGNPSGKKERSGTGVFLPRIDTTAESRKKLACSTVMVPDRVSHALNMNVGGMVGGYQQQKNRVNGTSNMENASSTAVSRIIKSDIGFSQRKRTVRTQPPANHEIRLPQEWTY